jgi:hypothetical protein
MRTCSDPGMASGGLVSGLRLSLSMTYPLCNAPELPQEAAHRTRFDDNARETNV